MKLMSRTLSFIVFILLFVCSTHRVVAQHTGNSSFGSNEFFVEGDEFDIGQVEFEIIPETIVLSVAPSFGFVSENLTGALVYTSTGESNVDQFELLAFANGLDEFVTIVGTVINGTISTEFSVEIGDKDFLVDIIGWANLSETEILPVNDSGMLSINSGANPVSVTVLVGQLEQDFVFSWIFDNFLSFVSAGAVASSNDWPESWPKPPKSIPGGPWEWHPDPKNKRGGTVRPVNPPKGQSTPTLTWSPPTNDPREGNPNGYWKHNDGLGKTQRYSPDGVKITPAQAHPGRPGKNTPKKTATPKKTTNPGNAAKGLGKLVIVLWGVHEVLDTVGDAIEEKKGVIEAWWDNYESTPWALPGFPNPDGPLGGGYDPLRDGA